MNNKKLRSIYTYFLCTNIALCSDIVLCFVYLQVASENSNNVYKIEISNFFAAIICG